MANPAAPTSQTIVGDDDDTIEIESLTAQHLPAARLVELEFTDHRKGCCFGMCPFAWCPTSQSDFDKVYQKDPDRMATYGIGILRQSEVVGICKGRRKGQESTWGEDLLHTVKDQEFYVDALAVTEEARGRGVGTQLLKWAEDLARERDDTKLTLGVMKGNPAKRLYERFGFVEVEREPFFPGMMIGCPHGSCTGIVVEKIIR